MMASSGTRKSTEHHSSTSSSNWQAPSSSSRYSPYVCRSHLKNVTRLLSWREVAPIARKGSRKFCSDSARCNKRNLIVSAKHELVAWLEAESLRNCTATYCPLQPAPRSTIAAAFSPDGTILASTHGDHTVKLICCKTGLCHKTLGGHRRTPWVVRFHPNQSDILASGSLDNEVKIWNANTAECIASHDFNRPIASIAFHAQGNLLAVASGHKLYIWQYNRRECEVSSPTIVLKTRRSLRAVHFHPHGAPLLLTAEVNGLDAPDCPMSFATSSGYHQYHRPAIFLTPVQQPLSDLRAPEHPMNSNGEIPLPSTWVWPTAWVAGNAAEIPEENMMEVSGMSHVNLPDSEAVPMDASPQPVQNDLIENEDHNSYRVETTSIMESGVDMLLRAAEGHTLMDGPDIRNPEVVASAENNVNLTRVLPRSETRDSLLGVNFPSNIREGQIDGMNLWSNTGGWSNFNVQVLVGDNAIQDSVGLELPFLQGWVVGQTQAGLAQSSLRSQHGIIVVPNIPIETREVQHLQEHPHGNQDRVMVASTTVRNVTRSGTSRGARTRGIHHRGSMNYNTGGASSSVHIGIVHASSNRDPNSGLLATETSPQLSMAAAAAAAELPCTVKLRIWPHSMKHPTAGLDPGTCRLTIPHAVLCSEMGAHFSPCGRFLAACVACVSHPTDSDASPHPRPPIVETTSAGTSPTRHPISAQQVIYELRVYSMEDATFGHVLASRAIRAAHCLTSIQFSPASEHILLAYGRRHSSLLRSIVVNGTTSIPIFTILEVYRVCDMELVKVLPSAEDEVNVACFHPIVGGGLAYGTKEGRLRIFRHERPEKQSEFFRTSYEDNSQAG